MLSVKKAPTFVQQPEAKKEKRVAHYLKLILPPFIIYVAMQVGSFAQHMVAKIKELCCRDELEDGQISKEFNRRRFEEHLQTMKLTQQQLGFTNQVLFQENKKTINYYLPVFITNKIKSIQDVSVQALTGNISCALIINVCFEGIPQEIITKLENSIIIQLNRGEAIKLEDDGISITVKREKKSKFLIFTIRKLFLAFLLEDTLWSPFELVELIISITLNTVAIAPYSLQKLENSQYCPEKEYKVSFNCMRNSDLIPISYALDCVFGVYDLAERKLESYHTRYGTISQIQKAYEEYVAREHRKRKQERSGGKEEEGKEKQREGKEKQREGKHEKDHGKGKKEQKEKKQEKRVSPSPKGGQFNLLQLLAQSTMKRLSLKPSSEHVKKPPPKVKYFQYTHFIIPLYKYPGNSLATIFIPIELLALVSLAIFFQEPQLSGRIGAIATMILGYIALIPSIKEQLPPSSKLTIIESVVYIQTMCCLLCLYESFSIQGQQYIFVWYENFTFLLCLFTHISTFIFILGVYAVHKLKWEKDYNCDEKVIEIKPGDNRSAWDNPYCDEVFFKFNKSIRTGRYTEAQREEMIIRPLKERNAKKSVQPNKGRPQKQEKQMKEEVKLEKEVKGEKEQSSPFNIFGMLLSSKTDYEQEQPKIQQIKKQAEKKPITIENVVDDDDFFEPHPNLYYNQKQEVVFRQI